MNPSFVDYLMPTINMMPRIETTLRRRLPRRRPLWRKRRRRNRLRSTHGVHRQRDLLTPPACAFKTLPLSPENVLRALKEAGKA